MCVCVSDGGGGGPTTSQMMHDIILSKVAPGGKKKFEYVPSRDKSLVKYVAMEVSLTLAIFYCNTVS